MLLTENAKGCLSQLPSIDDKEIQVSIEKMYKNNDDEDKIDVTKARNDVKSFFGNLFKGCGKIGQYLSEIAEIATDNAKCVYKKQFTTESENKPVVNH